MIRVLSLPIAENTMEQDEYGGYSKQQIGSLTTDGEGEKLFILSHAHASKEYIQKITFADLR